MIRTQPLRVLSSRICRGPGIDGFYQFGDGFYQERDALRWLAESGLMEVFGVEVLEEMTGSADVS